MSLALVSAGRTMLGFNRDTGLLSVLKNTESGMEYLRGVPQPVFALTLRLTDGKELRLTASDAATAHIEASGGGLRIWYNFLGGNNLCAIATIAPGERAAVELGIAVRNETGHRLVSIEYPVLLLPPALEGPASDWALASGALTNGIVFHGFENAFPSPRKAFDGSFAEPLQLTAFGTRTESVYLATMDGRHCMKNIQPTWDGANLRVSSTHYFDEGNTSYEQPYACGLEILADGSWCAAAEKYREWAETQEWTARKLHERPDVPKWWLQSPIVLSIKERAKRNSDMGQRPSPWCHPLEKGVPRILEIAKRLESTLKVQVFHWEHGGAFINGEHFPPLSGFDGVKRFLDLLHKGGHYGGFYILPLKWCLHGYATGYDGSRWFEEHDAMGNVCVDPELKPITSRYDWQWRKRFHMCGGAPVTRSEIVETFRKLAELGSDYLQLDTFNGRLYDCWSDAHGHYPGPGKWQSDLALSLIREIQAAAARPFIFTVEGEPVEALLQVGHGFVERGIHPQRPKGWEMIPLFQFVYHQYAQGFAGENCGSWNTPDNFYLVSAITVASGDMLMINLSEQGKIAMQTHEIDDFDQTIESVYPEQQTEKFIADLNRLRREHARELLVLGRMERPPEIACAIATILEGDDLHPSSADGHWKPSAVNDFHIVVPSVIGSSWTAPDGKKGTVLINHTTVAQRARVRPGLGADGAVTIQWAAGSKDTGRLAGGTIDLEMPALSALVIKA